MVTNNHSCKKTTTRAQAIDKKEACMYNYMQNSSCYFLKIEEQMTVRAKKRPLVHKLLTRKENKCIMKIGKMTLFF